MQSLIGFQVLLSLVTENNPGKPAILISLDCPSMDHSRIISMHFAIDRSKNHDYFKQVVTHP